MKNTIGCVIVNYNDWVRVKALVELLKEYDSIQHIVVVDNSSNKGNEVKKTLNSEKLVLIENAYNGGYGYGNNIGIRKAKELGSDYVIICNPDVIFPEKSIESMVKIIEEVPACVLVGCRETTGEDACGWKYTSALDDVISTSIIFNHLLKKRYYSGEYFTGKNWVEVDIVPGSFFIVKTDPMLQYGMYDEDMFLYEEEKTISKKLHNANYIFVCDLMAEYSHNHIDQHSVISNLKHRLYLIQSKRVFLKKYRRFNRLQLFISDIWFALCLVETFVISSMKLCLKID